MTQSATVSTIGGSITRSEVPTRAQYWVDQKVTYTQAASYHDEAGDKTYRRDCSGFVSMVWHLTSSFVTDPAHGSPDFKTWTGKTVIDVNDLQPGDAILQVDSSHDHIEMFVKWKDSTDHGAGAWFYSFNNTGETVRNPYAVNNVGKYGEESWAEMTASYSTPIRYTKIVNDSPIPASPTTEDDNMPHLDLEVGK
jgi:hypothetical protein